MIRLLFILLITISSNVISYGQHEISNSALKSIQVTIFLGIDCPVSQKYITRLNSIYSTYKIQDIEWHFIVPGKIKKSKIKSFVKEYNVQFEIASDKSHPSITAAYGASVTPEVFLSKGEKTIYKGAIDNWFYELGKYRQQVTENYLIDALEAVLRNEEPLIKETTPIGCFIQQSLISTHHHE